MPGARTPARVRAAACPNRRSRPRRRARQAVQTRFSTSAKPFSDRTQGPGRCGLKSDTCLNPLPAGIFPDLAQQGGTGAPPSQSGCTQKSSMQYSTPSNQCFSLPNAGRPAPRLPCTAPALESDFRGCPENRRETPPRCASRRSSATAKAVRMTAKISASSRRPSSRKPYKFTLFANVWRKNSVHFA